MPRPLALLALSLLAASAPAAAQSQCPQGFEVPAGQSDGDGDCLPDALERDGFKIVGTTAGREVVACTPGTDGCFTTDPRVWSTDGDPYSDLQEAAQLNLPIEAPYNHPLVAAVPQIRVLMTGYRFTPIAEIRDTRGGRIEQERETEVTVSSTIKASYETEATVGVTGPRSRTTARVEGTVSASYRERNTSTEEFSWETASTVDPSRAATLRLVLVARNEGGAAADSVRARFNLRIGGELVATVQMPTSFPGPLQPDGQTTRPVVVPGIELTLRELRQLQLGAPVQIEVIDLEADVIRWDPATSNWSCGGATSGNCPWDLFESEVNRQSVRLTFDFGYSGDPEAVVPARYFRNPYDYRVWVGEGGRPLRQILRDLGLADEAAVPRIGDRPFPSAWFATDGPEAQANTGQTFYDFWKAYQAAAPGAEWPRDLLDMDMPRQTSLALASPDPVDGGPVVPSSLLERGLRSVSVEATPRGSFAVTGGEAHLFLHGEEVVVPLARVVRDGVPTSTFALTRPAPLAAAAAASYVVLRDVSGSERAVPLSTDVPEAATCAELPAAAFDAGSDEDFPFFDRPVDGGFGVTTVFVGGDPNTPATVFCSGSSAAPGTSYWHPQAAPASVGSGLTGVAVLDAAHRVVVGDDVILRTEDGGRTWIDVDPPADAPFPVLEAVAFRPGEPGAEVGLAVGQLNVVLRTTDGGRSWTRVDMPSASGQGFYAVAHAGGTTWFVVGDGRGYRSTDDGQTWEETLLDFVDADGNAVARPGLADLRAVAFASETEGVVGDARTSSGTGYVYATRDGGATWRQTVAVDGVRDIAYNGRDGWAVVQTNAAGGRLFFSDDLLAAPATITRAVGESDVAYEAVDFGTPDVGFFVQEGGQVWRTEDGGRTWERASNYPTPAQPGAQFMRDVDALDANVAAVVGTGSALGATDSGGGFPTYETRGGVADEGGPETGSEADRPTVVLDPSYPNPVRDRATVPFRLGAAGPTRLAVVDLLGREVAVLVDGPLAAGAHEAALDASGLAAGVYVVRLVAGSEAAVRRVTVVR